MLSIIPKRKIWFTISAILVIASVVYISVSGLRLGIDFTGGSLLEISTDKPVAIADIEFSVASSLHSDAEIKVQSSGNNQYLIRTQDLSESKHQEVLSQLSELGTIEELRFESVGPTLGQELKSKAIEALLVASIVIILYIAWSFRKVSENNDKGPSSWKYGIGAIIALVHDVTIVTGAYALISTYTEYQVDALFVTALLVVLGYSVNDTIVVYDRVRENVIESKIKDFAELVNKSVNETVTRSINTSLTTLIVLLTLFFFGGESIQGFILALIIGVVIGTYSSIFLASPILVVWQQLSQTSKKKK